MFQCFDCDSTDAFPTVQALFAHVSAGHPKSVEKNHGKYRGNQDYVYGR